MRLVIVEDSKLVLYPLLRLLVDGYFDKSHQASDCLEQRFSRVAP